MKDITLFDIDLTSVIIFKKLYIFGSISGRVQIFPSHPLKV